jgi:hypothetical protein
MIELHLSQTPEKARGFYQKKKKARGNEGWKKSGKLITTPCRHLSKSEKEKERKKIKSVKR